MSETHDPIMLKANSALLKAQLELKKFVPGGAINPIVAVHALTDAHNYLAVVQTALSSSAAGHVPEEWRELVKAVKAEITRAYQAFEVAHSQLPEGEHAHTQEKMRLSDEISVLKQQLKQKQEALKTLNDRFDAFRKDTAAATQIVQDLEKGPVTQLQTIFKDMLP